MADTARLLREARSRHGLDQATLAHRAGTSQAQISRIEREKTSPAVGTLTRLLHAMGEELQLGSRPMQGGNSSPEDLRAAQQLTPSERLGEAIELSRFLTSVAAQDGTSADKLISALMMRGVEFVVIGGFSLAAHGVVRGTKDLDIVPAPASENLARLADALQDIAARPLLVEGFDPAELGLEPDASGLGEGGNWVLA